MVSLWIVLRVVSFLTISVHLNRWLDRWALGRIHTIIIYEPDLAATELVSRAILVLDVHGAAPDRRQQLQLLILLPNRTNAINGLVGDLVLLLMRS